MNLNEIKNLIEDNWDFDEKKYPELLGKSEEEKVKFALEHGVLHQMKSAGKMAEILEREDHGHDFDREALVTAIRKQIINSVQMAHSAGISIGEIEEQIRNWAK